MEKLRSKKLFKNLNYWSRKLHIHLGLFLLLFIWLFSFSGLILNHSKWNISNFYEKRKEGKIVSSIRIPVSRDSVTVLKSVLSQLKIAGEITDVKIWNDSLHFRVSAPGHVRNLQVNFKTGICTQNELKYNWSGKIQTLHTFNGVDKANADLQPNWLITQIWRLSMDGIAIGFIILCVSSWVMWYNIREKYTWGWVVLLSGFGIASYFIFLLGIL